MQEQPAPGQLTTLRYFNELWTRVRNVFSAVGSRINRSSRTELDWNGCHSYTQSGSSHGLFRKEVIQPQVLLRLPCYDFTPIMSHTLGHCPPCGLARELLVQPTFVM